MTPELLAWVDEQKPALVAAAESFLDRHPIHGADRRNEKVSASQLRNLLNAAQAEAPLAVLINLLRYQIGRERNGWGERERESGEALVALLQEHVGTRLKEQADVAARERYALESRLAALFLGYIVREYTYRHACPRKEPVHG